jgi:hypothetical protein
MFQYGSIHCNQYNSSVLSDVERLELLCRLNNTIKAEITVGGDTTDDPEASVCG